MEPGLDAGTVIGAFEVVAPIGEGGMAHIYKVRHMQDGRIYALKKLHAPHPGWKERLKREGEAQRTLDHPNVVRVFDILSIGGEPALLMEFIDGPSLHEFLLGGMTLNRDDVEAIGAGIIDGVIAAHATGRLHRDLKPANILLQPVDGAWIPKVSDFGLTKLTEGKDSVGSTQTGVLMGTPGYMSPEQARDSKSVDARTDVFALGCVLYELVTGQKAFDGSDRLEVLMKIVTGRYTPVSELRQSVPEPWSLAIMGAMATDLEHRIPDATTLLAVWRGHQAFDVLPPSTWTSAGTTVTSFDTDPPRPVRSGWRAAAGVGVVLAGVIWFVVDQGPPLSGASPPVHQMDTPVPKPLPDAEPSAGVVPTRASAPPTPAPAPRPSPKIAPEQPSMGRVVLSSTSDARRVWLVDDVGRHDLGAVPTGRYQVLASFEGEAEPQLVHDVEVEVEEDKVVTLHCDSFAWKCVVRP